MENRISELEYRNLEVTQVEERAMIFFIKGGNSKKLSDSIRKGKICWKGR